MTSLTVVATLYKSSRSLESFINRIDSAVRAADYGECALILVDDGCPDQSWYRAEQIFDSTSHLSTMRIIRLSKNFGHHKAIIRGLSEAASDHVFLIDSDLDERPEDLVKFRKEMEDRKLDLVFGVQEKRRNRNLVDWLGGKSYKIINLLGGAELPKDLCTIRLMTREYCQTLVAHSGKAPALSSLTSEIGFDTGTLRVSKDSSGESSYRLIDRLNNFTTALFGYGRSVLRITYFFLGLFSLLFVGMISWVLARLVTGSPPAGFTFLATLILGGLVFNAAVAALLASYLDRILIEVRSSAVTYDKATYDFHRKSSR